MRYDINKTNYHDFRTISVNRLPARSYFIPYPDREAADAQDTLSMRYSSDKVICLNGQWDFRFYPLPAELPDVLDTDDTDFDQIDVPSCWQFRGFARPFYVNARYQFPYDPPAIPETKKTGRVFSTFGADYGAGPRWKDPGEEYNFVGVYRTFFDVSDVSKRYILSFLGIASCADVYVNGCFSGYSEGSHNTAEYDVTGNVHEGRNELVVIVHRWCNGTYLECQDMFRSNGIFRDVLLRICSETDIKDLSFSTEKISGEPEYRAVVKAEVYSDTEVTFTVKGHGTDLSQTVPAEGGKAEAVFDIHGVKEWTAETPYLYDLYVETDGCCVKQRAGFRDVRIDKTVFLINGRKVKLHGVNHHDTSPVNGYAMTPDEIERDVRLCKEYNIDTIRTSHYPPDPLLLDLCDELGIYVIDEADIETHGTVFQKLPPSYNRISDDPKWAGHYVDRIKSLYQRDRNHASIIMWSLGNEAGGTFNTDLMYMYLKDCSSLPVHYESAVHTKRMAYDVASEMYPPAGRLHEVGEKKCKIKQFIDRPYFLCEYAHAMGVGPGGMEDYWKEIYSYDNLMGGCIWEMNDHAVLHGDGTYTYGGDHGEWEHDGNFCVDGLFYPDRTPSSGAKTAKFVYRPLRIRHIEGDTFEIFNTRSFTDGSAYVLELMWSDGITSLLTPDAGPLEKNNITIDTASHRAACHTMGRDCMLTIVTKDLESMREAAREQVFISGSEGTVLREHDRIYRGASDIVLSFTDGKPQITAGDTVLTSSDPYTILFRAPTDNDLILGGVKNTMAPFICEKERFISAEESDGIIEIKTLITCKGSRFICTDRYEKNDSSVTVTSTLHCLSGKGDLPRFGKAFRTVSSFNKVEYYGRNGESYADMKDHTQIEHVSCLVSDMTEPNIRPQESGNRCDTRWASVSDGIHTVKFTSQDRPFELGIKPYSDRELLDMKHREDEKVTGTYVTVSAFQQGLGTGICGPGPSREVCYPVKKDYVLRFTIEIE